MSLTKVSYSMISGAYVNVLDYGATGDGTTDDTVAIQNAINAIVDTNSAPLTLTDCYFYTGVTYPRIVETASTRLETVNAFVGADNVLGIAPWVWQYPTLAAGWSNKGSSNPVARYRLGNNGYVELGGMVVGGTGTIFTLPVGYRPPKRVDLPVCANYAFGAILIDTTGNVTLNVGSATDVSLENIGFFIY